MKTIKIYFSVVEDDVSFLKEKQQNYSYAFRKCYKNHDLLSDKTFMLFIKLGHFIL